MISDSKPWWLLNKDEDKANYISVAVKRAKELFEKLKDFRADSSRYFERVEYKNYNESAEHKMFKDQTNEGAILSNPYLTLNVTASCVETASNKVAKAKPKITFLTKGADRERREIASRLDKWVLKVFKKGMLWTLASQGFRSACICGLGIIKIVIKDSKVKFHKIPVFEFFCDNALVGNTEPTEAGEVKTLSFYEVVDMFPGKEQELKDEHGEDEHIKVYEIYKEYKKQIITTEKVLLSDIMWDKPLPYKFLKWETADQGVVSIGIAKKLQSMHNSITYILGKTFTSIRNFAVPRIFVSKGSEPTVKNIANVPAQIIEVNSAEDGKIPEFSTPPAVNNQVLEILLMLWEKSFEILGISSLSAGGQIPRGLEKASGAALRSYQNIESERFQLIRSDYEKFYVDITKLIFKLIPDSMLPEGVKKKDIEEMKEDCTIWTSSLLPETPSGRLAMVSDLFNTGLVTGSQAVDLLNSPDVNSYGKSETSRLKAIDIVIDRALEKNETPIFHPALGLDMTLDRARKKYALLLIEQPDEIDKIVVLGNFIKELNVKAETVTGIVNTLNAVQQAGGGQGGSTGGPRNVNIPNPPNTPTGGVESTGEGY